MKRKIIYCLIFLTGSVYQAHSQTIPKNSFRIGVGTAWPQVGEGTGMKGGIAMSNEYLRELKKRLFLGASLHYLTRHSGFKNQINYSGSDDPVPSFLKNKRVNHESVVAGYISLAFAPINTSKHLFLIGGGAGMQYKAYSQYWAYNPDRYFVESRRRIGASFNAMFGYDYRLNRQISLGVRQNYVIDGDVIPLLTIGAGIRI